MKIKLALLSLCCGAALVMAQEGSMKTFYDFQLQDIDGNPLALESFRGKAVLIVNVASRCGFTPQYEGLEKIYRQYKDKGFVVLGVPCNQFGWQEPGSEAEIKKFCALKYRVSFPMSSKVDVNGDKRDPLYAWLAGEQAAYPGKIGWNFEKFLVGKDGQVAGRFSSKVRPEDAELTAAIDKALA